MLGQPEDEYTHLLQAEISDLNCDLIMIVQTTLSEYQPAFKHLEHLTLAPTNTERVGEGGRAYLEDSVLHGSCSRNCSLDLLFWGIVLGSWVMAMVITHLPWLQV